MRIVVLTGFLGSGKTSFLLRLIDHLLSEHEESDRPQIAVIENEIGAVSVDEIRLREYELKVKELYAGCICCSLSGNLLLGIEEMRNAYEPDYLLIEATGLASASQIKAALTQRKEYLDELNLVVLIDAARILELLESISPMILRQLEEVDTLVLNKLDLVDENTRQRIRERILELKPGVTVHESVALHALPTDLVERIVGETK